MSFVPYTLNLRTAEGEQADAEGVRVIFFDTSHNELIGFNNLKFPPANRFELPEHLAGKIMLPEIIAPDFHGVKAPLFLARYDNADVQDVRLLRKPSGWKAKFENWNDLGNEFDRLKSVLQRSPDIKLLGGNSLGSLTDDGYNGLSTTDSVVAKTCLLNLYIKMSEDVEPVGGEYPWFKFVQRILSIGRERFIAVVDDEMFDLVDQISKNSDDFDDYNGADSVLHHKNFPSGHAILQIASIKSDEDYGNVQLTTAKVVTPSGQNTTLLDVDIDENGRLLPHFFDLIKHKFNGGTHPYEIHEYLVKTYPDTSLGYTLAEA